VPGPDVLAGRFALCDPLARGATGTVWRAWDLRRGDWCAAKLMRQRDAGDPLRFAREQGVRLAHPHLLTPYSWAAEDAHVVIASPLAGGGSLHTLLGDHGPLAPELVADLLGQLLDGLAYVHRAGIVHRDVTPANVLLEPTGGGRPVARLADFGLAVRVGEPRLTRLGTVLGTPGYVPPEVLAGVAPAPAADLYAVGQLALTLLTALEPDTAEHRPGAGGRVPGSDRLGELIRALTAPDPADRPGSAATARSTLNPAPALSPATATGDPVVVLTQLPDLPPGWTPTGPTPQAATSPSPRPVPPPAATADGAAPGGRAGRVVAAGGGGPAGAGISGPRRTRWRRPAAAGAVLVALGTATGIALLNRAGDGPGGTPAPTPSGVPVVTGPAVAGGACGWQQEGDTTVSTAGQALRCIRAADGFHWRLS
jgi:eukaryotic-like serine/threonine-protein kinase